MFTASETAKKIHENFTAAGESDLYRGAPMNSAQFENLRQELPHVCPEFPKLAAALMRQQEEKDGVVSGVVLFVPSRIEKAAWFEDIDYSAPIWLNLIALAFALLSLIR